MKVLLIGSGGREHALAWKLAQSKRVDKLYCAPGNAGVAEVAERLDKSVAAIEMTLVRARRGLRRCVERRLARAGGAP